MNREAMIEAATAAAKGLFTILIDELENAVRELREERPVSEKPVNAPLEAAAEAEPTPLVTEAEEESAQQKVEQVKEEANDAVQNQPSSPTRMALRSRGRRYYEVEDSDLLQIGQRLRLKSEGSRWAAKSKQLHQTETALLGRDLLEREREIPDCDLWMIRPTFVGSQDASDLNSLEGTSRRQPNRYRYCETLWSILTTSLRSFGMLSRSLPRRNQPCESLLRELAHGMTQIVIRRVKTSQASAGENQPF